MGYYLGGPPPCNSDYKGLQGVSTLGFYNTPSIPLIQHEGGSPSTVLSGDASPATTKQCLPYEQLFPWHFKGNIQFAKIRINSTNSIRNDNKIVLILLAIEKESVTIILMVITVKIVLTN